VLAEPGREREVLRHCLAKLVELPWDVCDLDGLARESATALQLAEHFPAGRATGFRRPRRARVRFVCPYIPLEGTYEQYLEGLRRRENLRPAREVDRAAARGRSHLRARAHTRRLRRRTGFIAPASCALVRGGRVGRPGRRAQRGVPPRGPCSDSPRGACCGCTRFLRRGGRSRRSTASFIARKFNYYQSGYDPNWASKSVGLVLLARTVQDAFAEGLEEFDFLHGNESYKRDWGARRALDHPDAPLAGRPRARGPGGAGRFPLTAREAMKAAVPRRALEAVRRARRILRAPLPAGQTRLSAAWQILREP